MKVYVGTYAKYNEGNLGGAWLELEAYADHEEFMEACKKLHEDEDDPEFMFQDTEDIPPSLCNRDYINPGCWDVIEAREEHGKDAVDAYIRIFDEWDEIKFRDTYRGDHNSWADFAAYVASETGIFNNASEVLQTYFDYEAFGRDMRLSGEFHEENGHYFSNW